MQAAGSDFVRVNQLLDQLSEHLDHPRGVSRAYATAQNSMAAQPAVAALSMQTLAEQLRAAASVADELASLADPKE